MSSNRAGGITLYQSDPGGRYVYYYAHLDRYAPGLAEGRPLQRGDLIGTVGSSGNARANAPHLHFAIYRPGTPGLRWPGAAINPYEVWRGSAGRAEPADGGDDDRYDER
jgi:murein DD-endopeptidase MepM/ murein hydrolase activator NlpD